MAISLQGLSPKELQDLIAAAQEQQISASRHHIQLVRESITALLHKEGLTLNEVFPTRAAKKGIRRAGAPKYVHPGDPARTWSGRGKRPAWFHEALAKGATEQSLLIGGSAKAPARKVVAKKVRATKAGVKKSGAKKASRKK